MRIHCEKANFSVEIRNSFEDKICVASKRFYAPIGFQTLYAQIKELSKVFERKDSKNSCRVILKSLDGKNYRSFEFSCKNFVDRLGVEEFQDEYRLLINELIEQKVGHKFRLVIDNHSSPQIDKKMITFNIQGVGDDVDLVSPVEKVIERFNDLSMESLDDDLLFFADEKKEKFTHRVGFFKYDGEKFVSLKYFSVRFPNCSSEDVVSRFFEK